MPFIEINIKNPQKIDTESELKSLIDFIKQTWHIPLHLTNENMDKAFRFCFQYGIEQGSKWCGSKSFLEAIFRIMDERQEYLEKNHSSISKHDAWDYIINALFIGRGKIQGKQNKNFKYEEFIIEPVAFARNIHGISELVPLGYGKTEGMPYSEIKKIYTDYSKMGYNKEYNGLGKTREQWEYDIINIHNLYSERSYPFSTSVALHNILYDDLNQGRDPIEVLFGDIIQHGILVGEHNRMATPTCILNNITLPDHFQRDFPKEFEFLMKDKYLLEAYQVGSSKKEFVPLS